MGNSTCGLDKILCRDLVEIKTLGKHRYVHCPPWYNRNNVENSVKHYTINEIFDCLEGR